MMQDTGSESDALKKATSRHRTEIAALKRRIGELEQQVARLAKGAMSAQAPRVEAAATTSSRFSAKGLRKHRERLDLSAPQLGKLFGVSAQTIYNWEAGISRPRSNQIAAIAALRKLGKREVLGILERIG